VEALVDRDHAGHPNSTDPSPSDQTVRIVMAVITHCSACGTRLTSYVLEQPVPVRLCPEDVLGFDQRPQVRVVAVEDDPRVGDGVRRGQRLQGGQNPGDRLPAVHDRGGGAEPARGLGEVEDGVGGEGGQEQLSVPQVLAGAEAIERVDDLLRVAQVLHVSRNVAQSGFGVGRALQIDGHGGPPGQA